MVSDRWFLFTKREQLQHIRTELDRASRSQHEDDERWYMGCLLRTLDLIQKSFADPKWKKEIPQLDYLLKEVTKLYTKQTTDVNYIIRSL